MVMARLLVVALVAGASFFAQTAPGDERSVFEAVLKDLLGKELPAALLIDATPRSFNYVGEFDWKRFGATPDALEARLKALSAAPFTADAFPPGAQVVTQQALADIF